MCSGACPFFCLPLGRPHLTCCIVPSQMAQVHTLDFDMEGGFIPHVEMQCVRYNLPGHQRSPSGWLAPLVMPMSFLKKSMPERIKPRRAQ